MGNENGVNLSMPVQPAGYGYGDGGFGGFGGIFGWIILLALCGFGGFGGWGGMMGGGMGLYPWMNQADITTSGFQNAQLGTAIAGVQNAVTSGNADGQLAIAALSQQVCNTGGNITAAINNGFSAAEIAANGRQMASMQQEFNDQIATLQGFNNMQSKFADCCCENRLATQALGNTIVSDGALTRTAIADGIQRISDKLCQLELDYYRNDNGKLRTELGALKANDYIQNALTAQTQYFLSLYPPTAAPARTTTTAG